MTLAQPYAYWTRNSSTSNAWGPGNPSVFNRVEALRDVQDLHVRTVMRCSVAVWVTTATPPPFEWWTGVTMQSVAEWTPQPSSTISSPFSGAPGIVATGWLEPKILVGTPTQGVEAMMWTQNQTENSRVFRQAPPANGGYPSVQSGIHLQDTDGGMLLGYSVFVRQRMYLETLWNSAVAP